MENGDKSAERLEMAAVKEDNHTNVADDIDGHLSQIDCLCQWYFGNYYPTMLKC